jgi:riboflavin synthase alpha subunit
MFTGLVREMARVKRVSAHGGVTSIEIEAPLLTRDGGRTPPAPGDSVAVNGVCLTIVRISGPVIAVEATAETRRVSSVADWAPGTPVHLEPSLRVGDELGGHFVLGHVDAAGRLVRLERGPRSATMTVSLPPRLARFLLPKGSVAVDGVSLTLDDGPFTDRFTVTLIPHTLAVTRFAALAPGTRLNIEIDMLAKASRRQEPRAPLTIGAIRNRGWS